MSQPQWSSLYVPTGAGRDALITSVASALAAAGAISYDPFGVMPGLSYPKAVKIFVAPPSGTWLRLIPSPDSVLDPIIRAVSAGSPLIAAEISADLVPSIVVYSEGAAVDALIALSPYVSEAKAFAAHLASPAAGAAGIGGVSGGALPANVRAMSNKLPVRQVERLMNTMSGALSKNERASAQAVLQSVEWNSGAGGWMLSLLTFLGLEDRAGLDYATLSTAFRTLKRLSRNAAATLYPGDAEARQAVPDALDYVPMFYGWKA